MKLMFFLVRHANCDNVVYTNNDAFLEFNSELRRYFGKGLTRPYYFKCIKELCTAHLIRKIGKSKYQLNMHVIWKGDKKKRIDLLKNELKSRADKTKNPHDIYKETEI